MEIRGWDERYRTEDLDVAPNPLLIETAQRLQPGKALDLACGTGRNALWLAEQGWSATAVDGAPTAIEILRRRASEKGLHVDARVVDLETGEYRIEPSTWDLIVISYYLQRDLFEPANRGLAPGGVILAIVHIAEPGEEPNYKRLKSGDLEHYFQGWEILHRYEGKPNDKAHQRSVAEVVARRPATESRASASGL